MLTCHKARKSDLYSRRLSWPGSNSCCGFFGLFGHVLRVVLPNISPVSVAGIFSNLQNMANEPGKPTTTIKSDLILFFCLPMQSIKLSKVYLYIILKVCVFYVLHMHCMSKNLFWPEYTCHFKMSLFYFLSNISSIHKCKMHVFMRGKKDYLIVRVNMCSGRQSQGKQGL